MFQYVIDFIEIILIWGMLFGGMITVYIVIDSYVTKHMLRKIDERLGNKNV